MPRNLALVAFAWAALAVTGASAQAPALDRTVHVNGLSDPWDIAFTPDGALLYTEKCQGLSVRRKDGSSARLFGAGRSALVADDMRCQGQSGMLGVAVDPEFARTRHVYVFMLSSRSQPMSNRVVRLRVDDGYTAVAERTDIVTDLMYKNEANAHGRAGAHSGGRIRFGPDGWLYITTGDNHRGDLPQDPARLGGKILRVDRDGKAAPGNNSPTGFDPRIFTYGHRNVQGIAFRPGSSQVYACEHGPRHTDEITLVAAAGNGGWDPRDRPGLRCADGYCGYDGNAQSMPMTDTARFPDAMTPLWTNRGRSEGLGPCTFLDNARWGEWDGRLLAGVMAARRLTVLELDQAGRTVVGESAAELPAARYRSLVQGPDDALYVAVDEGQIWRVAPK